MMQRCLVTKTGNACEKKPTKQHNITEMAKVNTEEKFVVALELGSSRAKIGIAGFKPGDSQKTLTVYNMATMPTVDIVRYGRITNIREVTETVSSLLYAIDKKNPIEGRAIRGLFISIGGRTLKSHKIKSCIVLPERREVTEDLMDRLQSEAINSFSTGNELIAVEPVSYAIDKLQTPRPLGSLGSRIEGEYVAVMCHPSNKNDLIDVVYNRVKLDICGIAVRPIALAQLVLSKQETNAGCMLVDFGAETITVSIYKKCALQYLATIPIGSRLITRDLAATLSLTDEEAENLKISMGDAMPEASDTGSDDETQTTVNAVVSARLVDIVANIAAQPGFAGLEAKSLSGGIILTGAGARLKNFARLLENNTGMKVRMATLPANIVINDTEMAAPENLDLIALLKAAADSVSRSTELECVQAPKAVDKSDIVIDFNNMDEEDEIVAAEFETVEMTDTEDDGYEFHPGDVFNSEPSTRVDKGYEKPFWIGDAEEEKPERPLETKHNQRAQKEKEKIKRQAEKERQREREREKEEQKSSKISWAERMIAKAVHLFGNTGEDESGDMD